VHCRPLSFLPKAPILLVLSCCYANAQVLQSRPEALVDTFMMLMPSSAQNISELARLCEIKVGSLTGSVRYLERFALARNWGDSGRCKLVGR
jgi:hypothetical protein